MSDESAKAAEPPDHLRYSLAYLRGGDKASAVSKPVRVRLRQFVLTTVASSQVYDWTARLILHLGIEHNYPRDYFDETTDAELFDIITETFNYFQQVRSRHTGPWLSFVRKVFAEEHLAYRITDLCTVRPLVDEAFAAQEIVTIAVLTGARYAGTLAKFTEAHSALEQNPPDTKTAAWHMFEALENLFKLMTGASQLTADLAKQHLPALFEQSHSEQVARRAAAKLVQSFADWIDGAHNYRHAPGTEEPAPPPFELAVAFLSSDAGFLRWLAAIDRQIQG